MKAVHEHRVYLSAEEVQKAIHEYLQSERNDVPDNPKDIEIRDDSSGCVLYNEMTVVWTNREPTE
jgi:hypothetical protein